MGKEIVRNKLTFVSFEPKDGGFWASLPLEEFVLMESDPDCLLKKATEQYARHITAMRVGVAEIRTLRAGHKLTPARHVWYLGDEIFKLTEGMRQLSLEIDGLYEHLARDLGVKRKWLEKVVIFRRYLPSEKSVPPSLNWGRCEKGTKRVAQRLRNGLSPDSGQTDESG